MRLCHLFALTLGAVGLIATAPAQACWWGHGGGRGMAYGGGWGYGGPRYVAPAPAYYAPGAVYQAPGAVYSGPAPVYTAPRYYAPPAMVPGTAGPGTIRMMPGTASPAPMPATTATVGAKDDTFDPPTLNVAPGTTVKWTNTGTHPHTVTDRGGKFDSGDIAPGASYTATFTTPGTYRYYCNHHKGMEGTIVVGEPGKGPATGPSPAKGSGY